MTEALVCHEMTGYMDINKRTYRQTDGKLDVKKMKNCFVAF